MSVLALTTPVSAEAIVRGARASQPAWAGRGLSARATVIEGAARLLAREADVAVAAIAASSGRPAHEIWSAEVVPTLDALAWLAREGSVMLASRPLGRSWLQWYFRAARHRLLWEPYGIMGVVTPGNGWLFLAAPQIAAALLAGNAVIWKPAPGGGALSFYTASLFYRAGLPPSLLQVLTGEGDAAHDVVRAGVDKLHFTGGSEAGVTLYREHAERGRPAVLELSGRHTSVVLHPVEADRVARGILWAKRANRGRNCVAVQLVLAEPPVVEPLLAALGRAMREHAPGEAAGGLRPAERARLVAMADDALARGARHVGGSLDDVLVLADVRAGMRLVEDEVQGPILGVAGVESGERAAEWVNQRPHRLSASIWAADVARARRLAAALDVGQVWINEQLHPTAQPEVTLAGRGASGFGASRGRPGLMEMVQAKVVSEMPNGSPRRHYESAGDEVVDLFRATVRLRFARGIGERTTAAVSLARTLLRLMRRS